MQSRALTAGMSNSSVVAVSRGVRGMGQVAKLPAATAEVR